MERRTERDGYIDAVYVKDHDYVEAAHKLADYEDIGTVEEFAALVQADSEDCKICIWKNRHQKCACCKRNRHLKDCFAALAAMEGERE